MNTDAMITRLAKKITAGVEYTSKGSPAHSFKVKTDTLRLYDKPEASKRFTVVLSGKDWDEKGSTDKTLIRADEKGNVSFGIGKEDDKLGKPAVFSSLPSAVKSKILEQVKGKYE